MRRWRRGDIRLGTLVALLSLGAASRIALAETQGIYLATRGIGEVRFVDASEPAGGDGLSWATAYAVLQDALTDAAASGGTVIEIWVAAGTYAPAPPGGDLSATFQLINGVGVYGGFAGMELEVDERDPNVNVTILSGDLADGIYEDSYHVVTGSETDETAILDGFTVTAGSAQGAGTTSQGGGIYINLGSPTISNCVVTNNSADSGAGMYNNGGSPIVTGCTFRGNWAVSEGGGMYDSGEHLTLIQCIFEDNSACDGGAGLYTIGSRPSITNCTFRGNTTDGHGGGIYNGDGSPTISNCEFTLNLAGSTGGSGAGMYSAGGLPMLSFCAFTDNSGPGAGGGLCVGDASVVNCDFVQNLSGSNGGGLSIHGSAGIAVVARCSFVGNRSDLGGALNNSGNLTLTNCVFSANIGEYGGGLRSAADTTVTNCTFNGNSAVFEGGGIYNTSGGILTITNCILWGNHALSGVGESPQIYVSTGAATVNYSCVQGGAGSLGGEGNTDKTPLLTPDGHLKRGSPCIDAGDNDAVCPDGTTDIDGDPTVVDDPNTDDTGNGTAPIVDMGADEFLETDGNGLPDFWEANYFGLPTGADPDDDPDSDGLSNLEEYEQYGSNPIASPYYVDGVNGDDAFDGTSPTPVGNGVGPKRTIQAGMNLGMDGDTILVAPAVYTGSGNSELDYDGKWLVVRASEGSGATTIDCAATGPAVSLDGFGSAASKGAFAVLEGFTIINGEASRGGGISVDTSRFMLRDSVLTTNNATSRGGGIYIVNANTSFDGVTLTGNTASTGDGGYMFLSNVNLPSPKGGLTFWDGSLEVQSSWIFGPGRIEIGAGARIIVIGTESNSPPTVLRSNVVGTGDIQIDLGQQLRIEYGAIVNLSGSEPGGDCPEPGDSDAWGTITVDGELIVVDSTIEATNIVVTQVFFEGNSDIINNDITLPESSADFGAQFFASGSSTIRCNIVTSYGDRYFDMDPDPEADPRPTFEDNTVHVIITQGTRSEQGTLLELRTQDFDCDPDTDPDGCASGAYPAPPESEGFFDDWALASLTIDPEAKVNLTNRQGFVFQNPDIPAPETMYVDELILGDGAILNTAFQRLYYQTLSMGDGATIVDIPLLGFSLITIAMEDDTEFAVRVRTRIQDPSDNQPNPPANPIEGSVTREDGLDPGNGVMDIQTLTASSVAAKGAFAKAGEDEITIAFRYLFVDNPNAELIIYLSDDSEVSSNIVEVARIDPPSPGRKGSIGGDEFATFIGAFERGDLNFTAGTYVELELRGAGSRIWIDDWDPVACSVTCADMNSEETVSAADFLHLLSEYGRNLEDDLENGDYSFFCADSALTRDLYIDMGDLLAWDAHYNDDSILNFCIDGSPPTGVLPGTPVALPANSLVIAGKDGLGGNGSLQEDFLYALDRSKVTVDEDGLTTIDSEACLGDQRCVASAAGMNGFRGNGRLIRDASGQVYQIQATQGLIRLSDAKSVVPPGVLTFEDNTVHLGPQVIGEDFVGVPVVDAAFHAVDDTVLYIVPVWVTPPSPGEPYKAAAKLRLSDDPSDPYTVEQLYGTDPEDDADCDSADYAECNVWRLREIEIDTYGNVLVTSSSASNDNDWLLIYDEATGTESRILLNELIPSFNGAAGLLMSATGDTLYVASSANAQDATTTELFRLSVERDGSTITGLSLAGATVIQNMGHVTDTREDPNTGWLWVIGFTMPTFGPGDLFTDDEDIFTTATLALVPKAVDSVTAAELGCHDIALPLSMVFNDAACAATMDWDGDGDVDLLDFRGLQICFMQDGCIAPECVPLDSDCDGDVDLVDLATFQEKLTGPV